MSLSVQVFGLDKAIKNLDDYIERKQMEMVEVVAHAASRIEIEAKKNAPKDLGELRREITHTAMQRKYNFIGKVESGAPYSAFVEYGTRPHRAPASALKGWAERHGIPLGAVLHSIATKGTPAQPFMHPAYIKVKPEFIENVKKALSRI